MRKMTEPTYGAISLEDDSISDIEGAATSDDDDGQSCGYISSSQCFDKTTRQFPQNYQNRSRSPPPPLSEVFIDGDNSTYSSITRIHRRKLYIVICFALALASYGYLALMEHRILRHVKHDQKVSTVQRERRPSWLEEQWKKTRLFKQLVGGGAEVVPLMGASKDTATGGTTDGSSLVLVVYGPADDPWQQLMAKMIGEGIYQSLAQFDEDDTTVSDRRNTTIGYRIQSIDNTTFDEVLKADGIILGSSVENANVHPEVQQWINTQWDIGEDLSRKVGAAFITAGGISAGQESSLLSLIRSMLIFNMIIVGGDTWMAPFGASAITYEGRPFGSERQQEDDDEKASLIDPLFLEKARRLGKRVVEVVTSMKYE